MRSTPSATRTIERIERGARARTAAPPRMPPPVRGVTTTAGDGTPRGSGRIAHESTVKALGLRNAAVPFAHGAAHKAGAIGLYDSYHCSRYNTNTGVLTPKMFREVFAKVRADLG